MRRRLRVHLTYANVMVTILAFLVIGGGTALASYIVSDNSQIGPNSVSGHNQPPGDHANIIGGSVDGFDLANGSVGGKKLANGSVSTSKVANGSLLSSDIHANTVEPSKLDMLNVTDALGVRYGDAGSQCTPSCGGARLVDSEGPWLLTGTCVNDRTGVFHAEIHLTNSTAAIISVDDGVGQRVAAGTSTTIDQTGIVTDQSGETASKGGEFSAFTASAALSGRHISGHVLALADGGATDNPNNGNTGFCKYAFEGLGS